MLTEYYTSIVAFHVIAIISWMAALLYLPRLYVNHIEHQDNYNFLIVMRKMEYKLQNYIAIPAFWASLISGIALIIANPSLLDNEWFTTKLIFVFFMIIFFIYLSKLGTRVRNARCKKSGRFFRILNEVPTILMIGIVIMVIVKPF